MAGPWEKYAAPAAPEDGPWSKHKPEEKKYTPYSGAILPFSRDEQGNPSFDSNAGIVGAIKRAVTLPADVIQGKVQLPSSEGLPGTISAHDPTADQALGRVLEMATVATPLNPAARSGELLPGMARRTVMSEKPKAPTAEALKEASEKGYDAARSMDVSYKSDAVRDLATRIRAGLEQDGVIGELAPRTFSILEKLQNPPEGSVATLANFEAARRAFGHSAKVPDGTERLASSRSIGELDRFLSEPVPGNFSGPAAAAAETLKDARGNYAAASRSDKITGALDTAELNAGVANSGANGDNAIRQRLASLLKRPAEARGYSPEELERMRGVATGGVGANTARVVGNVLGGGGGLGAWAVGAPIAAGAMTATGSPWGMAAGLAGPGIGAGSKALAEALTKRGATKLDEQVRKRSPLYDEMLAAMPREGAIAPTHEALIRALMAQRPSAQQ